MRERLSLADELKYLRGSPQNLLFEGASGEEIEETEELIGKKLPQSFKFFLQASNGACLYQTETILGTKDSADPENEGFQISLARIKEVMNLPDYLVPFYISSDIHFFDTREEINGEYKVISFNENSGEVSLVAESFTQWLNEYILKEFETGTF